MIDCNLQATAATPASAKKTPRSSSSSSKRTNNQVATIADRHFNNQSLKELGTMAFMRKMTLVLTPEIISRLGNKWYSAVNKPFVCGMLRNMVLNYNYEGYAAIYDKMRAVEPRQEGNIATRFLRTGQHAARGHRQQVAALVARLFAQTEDLEMEYIKESVFGVVSGAPIMRDDHPALQDLFKTQTGAFRFVESFSVPSFDSQCTRSCTQMRNSLE